MDHKKKKNDQNDETERLRVRIAGLEKLKEELEKRLAESEREKRRIEEDFEIHLAETIRFQNTARRDLERYQALVANIPGAVYRAANDKESTMEFISDQVEEITGYPASDFINNTVRSFPSIMSQDDIIRVYDEAAQCLELMKPFAVQYKIIHKNGTLRWISHRGRGVFSHDGALLWFDGVIFDITDQMTFFGLADSKEAK